MPKRVAKAHPQAALEKARKALEKAEAAKREAFRVAVAKLFTEYQLRLEPNVGDEMLITDHEGEFAVERLPK